MLWVLSSNVPKLLEVLSTPNVHLKALEIHSAPSSTIVPLADRYAVVPDSNINSENTYDVPEVPQIKKARQF